MSREIKFRAWDKKHKQYVKVLKIYFGANGHILGAQVEDYDTNFAFELQAAQFVLEPSTGLKDKNGKEIYKGDVIKMPPELCINPYKPIGVVEFGYGSFYVKDEQYEDNSKHVIEFYDYNDPTLDFEVIGNIHENPELLGKAK